MSGVDITVAVNAVFAAAPGQNFKRPSLTGKQQSAAFLAALLAPWAALLVPARAACQAAAVERYGDGGRMRHQSPAVPSVVTAAAMTAASADADPISPAEKRALLGKLGVFMGFG